MERRSNTSPELRLRGVASAVLFLTFFSTLWALVGIGGMQGLYETPLFIVTVLIGLALLVAGVSLRRIARHLPRRAPGVDNSERQGNNKWFTIIFGTELILILASHAILSLVNRLDLFIPASVFIVGIHFFPLAALFRVRIYYLVGALLCVLAIVSVLAVPQYLKLDGHQIASRQVILGLWSAFILWVSGFLQFLTGKRLLATRTPEELRK